MGQRFTEGVIFERIMYVSWITSDARRYLAGTGLYGAVSLPISGLDVSTFYGRRYLCANYVCVMDNV